MNDAGPFVALSARRFNVGILIREGLKELDESVINMNSTALSCTDTERLLLIVEEIEISYLPLNDTGDIDQSATPLVLHRSSDLCEIFKNNGDKNYDASTPATFRRTNHLPSLVCLWFSN